MCKEFEWYKLILSDCDILCASTKNLNSAGREEGGVKLETKKDPRDEVAVCALHCACKVFRGLVHII